MAKRKTRKVSRVSKKQLLLERKMSRYNIPNPREASRYSVEEDKRRPAKKKGWRTSASGRKYYEVRSNRSDKNKKRRL